MLITIAYLRNTNYFEKYVRIKIEDHKILVLMCQLSPKFDEVKASYPCEYNSILWDFCVFHCISSIYHIIHFFEKYVRIKIEDHKILFLWVYVHGNRTNPTQEITLNILECWNWETSMFDYICGNFLHWVCPISVNFHSLEWEFYDLQFWFSHIFRKSA